MPLATPSRLELGAIHELIDFKGLRVLEIGAGAGRLTRPFAGAARRWIALDPDVDEVRWAARDLRELPLPTVRLALGDARRLGFPDGAFDLVFFTWSLC